MPLARLNHLRVVLLLHVVDQDLLVELGFLVEVEDASSEVVHLRQHQGVVQVVLRRSVLEDLQDALLPLLQLLLTHPGVLAEVAQIQLEQCVVDGGGGLRVILHGKLIEEPVQLLRTNERRLPLRSPPRTPRRGWDS